MIHSDSKKMDPKIKCFSELYFDYYVKNKGIERFKKNILDEIKNFKIKWLRDAFEKISLEYDCKELNYDNWVQLTSDEDFVRTYELLYQVRLAFAELYRKYNKQQINGE